MRKLDERVAKLTNMAMGVLEEEVVGGTTEDPTLPIIPQKKPKSERKSKSTNRVKSTPAPFSSGLMMMKRRLSRKRSFLIYSQG